MISYILNNELYPIMTMNLYFLETFLLISLYAAA